MGARQTADLAELKDWVEGIRAAAHIARQKGNVTLAKALDVTRFEVYESYLDEEYTNNRAKRLLIKAKHLSAPSVRQVAASRAGGLRSAWPTGV